MSRKELEQILDKTELSNTQRTRVLEAYDSKPPALKDLQIGKLAREKKNLGRLVEQLRHS